MVGGYQQGVLIGVEPKQCIPLGSAIAHDPIAYEVQALFSEDCSQGLNHRSLLPLQRCLQRLLTLVCNTRRRVRAACCMTVLSLHSPLSTGLSLGLLRQCLSAFSAWKSSLVSGSQVPPARAGPLSSRTATENDRSIKRAMDSHLSDIQQLYRCSSG